MHLFFIYPNEGCGYIFHKWVDKTFDPVKYFNKDHKADGWILTDSRMNVLRKEGKELLIENLGNGIYNISYCLYKVEDIPVRACLLLDRKGGKATNFIEGINTLDDAIGRIQSKD